MEDFKNIYNSICRLCLSYSSSKEMVPLIEENSHGLTPYAKAVSTFANINFTKQDCLPKNMCSKCLYLLKQAIHFKLVAESSDNCLKQMKYSVGSNSEYLKEKIIEFTMLKFYFPSVSSENTRECSKSEATSTSINRRKQKMANIEKVYTYQQTSENSIQDDILDTPALDSDPDKETPLDKNNLLDKIQSVMGLNSLNTRNTPIPAQKVFQKKKVSKRMHLKAREQLMLEIKKMKEKQTFVCNICNKVLSNHVTYNNHMQMHNGYRFICEHCGKGFPAQAELHYHQVLRHDKGPYIKCRHCPFKSPKRFEMIEHERIHSGERPYTCDKCGLTFRRRGIWSKHLLHHSEKKIQCLRCPKKFYERGEMLAHMNNIHNRVYVFSCSECDVTYAKNTTVRRHLTERHGIPREMQGKIKRIKVGGSQE